MRDNDEILQTLERDGRLEGRTAIVTGSSSGIGEAIARVLAASGAHVIVSGRDRGRAEGVVETIRQAGGRADAVTVDLAGPADGIRAFAREAERVLGGRVDILVNSAGVYPGGATVDVTDDEITALLDTNIRAPHVLVASLVPGMLERGSGVIVNVGSWMARIAVAGKALYPATKAALEQLTRGWAAEFGPHGIRVNGVAPGGTATPGNAESTAALEALAKTTPAGVPVRPVDIAFAVRWLASDEAEFVMGSSLDVDGGIAVTRSWS